jgi:acetyl esterase
VPVTELRSTARSTEEFAEGYGLTKADMEWYGAHYLSSDGERDHPYASVLRADLKGLPPAFLITAECDPLRDDGEAYAERLRAAGVRAKHKRYPGMFHGFLGFPAQLAAAAQALEDAGAALREAFARR